MVKFNFICSIPEIGLSARLLGEHYPLIENILLLKAVDSCKESNDLMINTKMLNVKPRAVDFQLTKGLSYEDLDNKIEENGKGKILKNIFIDDAELLTADVCDNLKKICFERGINVFAYGKRVNSEQILYEGSKRIIELSHEITFHTKDCEDCGEEIGSYHIEKEKTCKITDQTFKYFNLCYSCKSKEREL